MPNVTGKFVTGCTMTKAFIRRRKLLTGQNRPAFSETGV